MTQYELPDGFEGMETAPKDGTIVNTVSASGGYWNEMAPYSIDMVGWAPIVPLKVKARFVVRDNSIHGPFVVHDEREDRYSAFHLPTRESAQRIADIYNEVMP